MYFHNISSRVILIELDILSKLFDAPIDRAHPDATTVSKRVPRSEFQRRDFTTWNLTAIVAYRNGGSMFIVSCRR